ncbi:acetyltransferase [Vibrio sp. 10N.261.51.F12]|uniref:acetyltransferase n=1 Tax=Vibrio sp. 10N.261.51.F12 TaxID=3229679 RepID=UPI0035503A04
MTNIAILGSSGHGKVIAELAVLNGFHHIHFFDDAWPNIAQLEHWQVVGNTESLIRQLGDYDGVAIAIGNNAIRLEKFAQLSALGAQLVNLIHPSAAVSELAKLGKGVVVMANASINPFASIGNACIINTNSSIDHDCVLRDAVHISPGANLAGAVSIGQCSWIGIGSQVKQLINIGVHVVVGAGGTVINDIPDNQMVVGTPAKPLHK